MGAYKVLFIGGLVFAILFLIATVVLFFLLKISKVFGVLTGRAQKKALEDIRNAGQATVAKSAVRADQAIKAHEASVETAMDTSEVKSQKEEPKKAAVKEEPIPTPSFDEQSKDAGRPVGTRAGRDYTKTYEETEVLGVEEYDMESGTEILTAEEQRRAFSEEQEGTDVLNESKARSAYDRIRSAMSYDSKNSDNLGYGDEEDTDTDVLKSSVDSQTRFAAATAAAHEYADSTAEEISASGTSTMEDVDSLHSEYTPDDDYHVLGDDAETAVLRSGSMTGTVTGAGVYAADGTAVLTEGSDSGKIVSHDGAAIADEVMQPKDKPGITYLYSKTVVHTDESL